MWTIVVVYGVSSYHWWLATSSMIRYRLNVTYNTSYEAHPKNKGLLASQKRKCSVIAEGCFSRITETSHSAPPQKAVYSENSMAIHSISLLGYVKSVKLAFVLWCTANLDASSSCELFEKLPFVISPFSPTVWFVDIARKPAWIWTFLNFCTKSALYSSTFHQLYASSNQNGLNIKFNHSINVLHS